MDIAMIFYQTWRYISGSFIYAFERIMTILGIIDEDHRFIG